MTSGTMAAAVLRALRPGWTTRFAPAPTGFLHLGHVVSAMHVWGLARACGGRVLLRIEDHDRTRWRAEFEAGIHEDLTWLGLVPDLEVPPQRDRGARYAQLLAELEARALAYPCRCSRRDIAAAVGGDVFNEESRYPGTCATGAVPADETPARRVRLAPGVERFDDLALGPQAQEPALQCGDLLVRDRLGQWTYQFAVTVDDLDQGVDVVIRGEDLLPSTGRQLALSRLLGRGEPARYLHHGLLRHPDGSKLSKSLGDAGIRELRAAGVSAPEVLGRAAHLAGVTRTDDPLAPDMLASLWAAR